MADVPADDPDRALIRAAAGGDAHAFEGFVRRYEQRIVSLAATIVGPQEAEDVAQEVFVRIYRALPTFRGDSAVRTWLYRIAVNVGRSYRSHWWRRAAVWGDSGADETAAFDPEDSSDFEATWLTRDAIERALAPRAWCSDGWTARCPTTGARSSTLISRSANDAGG